MTNVMIVIMLGRKTASPKLLQERWPTGFDYIIPLSADSITERYKLKFESSVYPQIPCHKWTTRNKLQAFFFDKTENKHKVHRSREGLASTTHFVLVVETQRIHSPKCFKNPDKKKLFCWTKTQDARTMTFMWRLVWYAMSQSRIWVGLTGLQPGAPNI